MSEKQRVLFLCTHNAARSQMAEALLRRTAGERFDTCSAGLEPTTVHPFTREVLSELGIDCSQLRAKGLKEFFGTMRVDWTIVVCAQDEGSCPRVFPFSRATRHWPFDDPASVHGSQPAQLAAFRHVRDQIHARIKVWLRELDAPVA